MAENTSLTSYSYNVTTLRPDGDYVFRVDVHYSDDGKLVDTASPGLPSDPTRVPCTS